MSSWLRPGAATSPERLFCHVYGRGKGQAQMIPGWPYSVIAALDSGRTSWTAVLDAVRLGPDDDQAEVTATQVRDVVARLIAAGHWRQGDPPILIIVDARHPWERPAPPGRLTPARVRRGFGTSARPCPARPVHRNQASPAPDARQDRRTAAPQPRHDVGKTTRRQRTLITRRQRAG